MKKHVQLFFFFAMLFFQTLAQNVNITTKVDGFRHNWDCCNDGAAVGCVFSNYPDPRYIVWVGYNGSSFVNYTATPGLYSGCSNTYGADNVPCSTWNPGVISGASFANVPATSVNVDMQSWESDGCGSNCVSNGPSGNPFDACFYNADDTRCGRLRIGDIDFTALAPCQDNTYTGQFTSGSFLSMTGRCSDNGGAGYGIDKFIINWNFASAPTVTVQPDAPAQGGALREVCPGVSVNFNVQNNKFGTGNWTLARWVKWQSAPAPGGPWTDIPGTLNATVNTATSFFYGFTAATPGTTYYRAALSSDCSNIFSAGLTTYSNTVQVLIHNASDAFCSAISCDIAYVDPTIVSETGATGTPANPLKYISTAVASGSKYVRVAKCASGCTDVNVVQLLDGVVVEGGYVRSGTFGELWTKSSAATDKTIITFSGQENAPGGNNALRHIAAFKSDAKKNWTIKDLDIVTANPPAGVYANDGRGMSNYGILIINNSSNYNIVRCNITTGNGGAGNNGATNSSPGGGAGGSGGGGGSNGNSGTCSTSNNVAAGTAGDGGTGAAAAINTTNTGAQTTTSTATSPASGWNLLVGPGTTFEDLTAAQVRAGYQTAGTDSYIPLRIAQAGVMPIIFAGSILQLPQILSMFFLKSANPTLLSLGGKFKSFTSDNLWYMIVYFVLIFFFTYFYTAVTFDAEAMANNLQKNGAFVPNVRPGAPTADYVATILARTTFFGAVFFSIIAVMPFILQRMTGNALFAIGGTAILIAVSVCTDLIKKLSAQASMKEY